ncbi:serine/threonine-protein kinase [Corynebacterium sp. USCH3]|uniref:serine/threonine-protein kinase n=1 Tax=Corynebacterium sp. USCH3 TaxID=3024840 RepID=UPI0030EB7941
MTGPDEPDRPGGPGNPGNPGNPGDPDGTRVFSTPEEHSGPVDPAHMTPRDRAAADRLQRVLDGHYDSAAGRRFEVSRIIGRGGMSTVWLAYDTVGERDVAVKVLKPELTDDAEFRDRFRQEAEAAETIQSDNVVRTFDYGEQSDVDGSGIAYCFIVMEYVQGESLADILGRQRTLPEVMVLDLIAQAAVGLQAIHERRLIHRDIKPGNLMVTADGVVKITDFGIAKAASAVPLTRTGMVVGTAQYVSPEQAQGLSIRPSSDIYSLGVVGYEVLVGERPFAGDSTVSVALKHINEPAPELPGNISAPMRQLIAICLRKDPARRYADGAALAAATVPVRDGQMPPDPATGVPPGAAAPVPPPTGQSRLSEVTDESNMGPAPRTRGNRGWIWALGIGLVVVLGVLVWFLTQNDSETPVAPTQTTTVTNEVTEEQTVVPEPVETDDPVDTATPTTPTGTTPTEGPTDGPTDTTDPGQPTQPTVPEPEVPTEEPTDPDTSDQASQERPDPSGNAGTTGDGDSGDEQSGLAGLGRL